MSSELNELKKLSRLLDSKFSLGKIKFGLDSLIGLIPIFGDSFTFLLSTFIILKSITLGYPKTIILRMLINVLIDNIIGSIPIIGNIFDFFWKSNNKNIQLMESYLLDPKKTYSSNRFKLYTLLSLTSFIVIGSLFILIYISYKFINIIFNYFQN